MSSTLTTLPDPKFTPLRGGAVLRWGVLAPGGIAVHLDFLPPDDTLLRLLYEGHSRRNNEPFMRDLAALDLQAVHREAGFERVEITPFAEADCVLDGPPSRWRLPWTMITATKPLTGMST